MTDLSMPQRQTFPHIRGRAEDQAGALPLDTADELTLYIEIEGGALFELPATALDPDDPTSTFLDEDGNEVDANFEAPIGASGISDDVVPALRGKLQITWDAGASPPLIQFVPRDGFMTFAITENVQADT